MGLQSHRWRSGCDRQSVPRTAMILCKSSSSWKGPHIQSPRQAWDCSIHDYELPWQAPTVMALNRSRSASILHPSPLAFCCTVHWLPSKTQGPMLHVYPIETVIPLTPCRFMLQSCAVLWFTMLYPHPLQSTLCAIAKPSSIVTCNTVLIDANCSFYSCLLQGTYGKLIK